MKGWGDHCSSDDESVEVEEVVLSIPVITEPPLQVQERTQQQQQQKQIEEQILPIEPPFKAYVGNLAFAITQKEALEKEITRLCQDRFQATVNIIHCHLPQDRHTGQMRGYGYVEVETLNMLQTLLKLSDGKSQIAGKTILVELVRSVPRGSFRSGADKHRTINRKSNSDADGTTFRSSRFHKANKNNGAPPPPRGEIPRSDTVVTTTNEPSTQRQKLQLKPKTQRNDNPATSSAYADIFGAGKKQDVGEWEQRRQKEKKSQLERTESKEPSDTHLIDNSANINSTTNEKPSDRVDRRQPGREREGQGGRGRGRSIGSGASGRNSTNNSARGGREGRISGRGGVKVAQKVDAPKPVTRAFVPVTKPTDKEKTPNVINKFSALAFGEDSDSD